MKEFVERYGPWALVAGGARGIGEAYSRYLAAQGLNVAVIDVAEEALEAFAPRLAEEYGVECLPLRIDLAHPDLLLAVTEGIADREVGMLIYNAALGDGVLVMHQALVEGVTVPDGLFVPSMTVVRCKEDVEGLKQVTPDQSAFAASVPRVNVYLAEVNPNGAG